jgi:ArsR family transcriptional regulator
VIPIVQGVDSRSLDSIDLEALAAGFSALGDPVRLRVLDQLASGQRCVCELLDEIGVAPNLLSYHLRVLREAELVDASRRGRWVDYRLSEEGLAALRRAIPSELGA